jgi:hypothetical protein
VVARRRPVDRVAAAGRHAGRAPSPGGSRPRGSSGRTASQDGLPGLDQPEPPHRTHPLVAAGSRRRLVAIVRPSGGDAPGRVPAPSAGRRQSREECTSNREVSDTLGGEAGP